MTAHTCTAINPLCYRCDLGQDEAAGARADIREEAIDAGFVVLDPTDPVDVQRLAEKLARSDYDGVYRTSAAKRLLKALSA